MIVRKTPAELEKMRRSGLLVWQILEEAAEMAVEGVSTLGSGNCGGKDDRRCRARPAFKGYYVPGGGREL